MVIATVPCSNVEVAEGDATLIARAPDLLAENERLRARCDEWQMRAEDQRAEVSMLHAEVKRLTDENSVPECAECESLRAQLAELREAARLAQDSLDHAGVVLEAWAKPHIEQKIYGGSAVYCKVEGASGLLRAALARTQGSK